MSWWEDQVAGMTESPVILGGLAAAGTAFIRTYRRHPGMRFVARVGEAATCSMLSTMLTYVLVLHFGMAQETAIPTGVFCGFLGTDTILVYLTRLLDHLVPHNKKPDESKHEEAK